MVKSGFIDNYSNSMVASNDVGAEVATLLTGPAWSGQRAVELGSMVTADGPRCQGYRARSGYDVRTRRLAAAQKAMTA